MLCGKVSGVSQFLGSSKCASRPRAKLTVAAGTTSTDSKAKIYIGFEKNDYKPREGRQGRFLVDDAKKYPDRSELTGGWAGGEVGLKQFVEEYKKAQANPPPQSKIKPVDKVPKPIGKGKDTVYLGYQKEDYEARRMGEKGRVITDDARKYPQRNELTGGFAGGELGLKKYVELGDVPILEPGKKGRGQGQNPLIIAALLGGAAVVGGLVLIDVTEVSEAALSQAAPAVKLTGLDDNTRTLLQAAVLLTGLTGVVAGGRAIVSAAADSLKEGAVKLGTLAVFWVAVFLVAQYVLNS